MKYFSMFSGVGGFELGIGDLGECIGYSEIDKYAIITYERHYEHANYGDATLINERKLPDFELLVGGFPCQAFSIAGQRKGFNDTRGTLFFDIARVLKHKRPRHLVLENVKGLLTHEQGKTFQTILGVLADLGYGVEWQVFNGKRYVPQNRERVIIIGHLRGECRRTVLPFRESNDATNSRLEKKPVIVGTTKSDTAKGTNSRSWVHDTKGIIGALNATEYKQPKQIKIDEVHPTIDANYYKGPSNQRRMIEQLNNPKHSNDRVYGDNGISPSLNTMQGGLRQPFVAPVLTPDRLKKRQNGRRMKNDGEPAFTLNTQDVHGIYNGTRIRRLTPKECERLMGWPDNWTEGVSDTQRYKQCGNGIIAPMVNEIITKMQECLV